MSVDQKRLFSLNKKFFFKVKMTFDQLTKVAKTFDLLKIDTKKTFDKVIFDQTTFFQIQKKREKVTVLN